MTSFQKELKEIVDAPLPNEFKNQVLDIIKDTYRRLGRHSYEFSFDYRTTNEYPTLVETTYSYLENLPKDKENKYFEIATPQKYMRYKNEINDFMVSLGFVPRERVYKDEDFKSLSLPYYSITF